MTYTLTVITQSGERVETQHTKLADLFHRIHMADLFGDTPYSIYTYAEDGVLESIDYLYD